MSATRTQHPAQRQIADALAWLRAHVAPTAGLHADTRSLEPGDVFVAYAVEGADNRAHIANAIERGAAAVLFQPEGYAGQKLDASIALAVPQLEVLAGEIASGWYGDPSDAMLV
ncbi:MAG: UDP-N-acetylmuramoyl-L-alanyl-D-glutamate--2,6-diaminopimelate ligase, partial [Paraburkholderia sp.]|nr:UDP-N-acetylmuramoyl-L-alanyl-D-glutamate--2,6-diaminopimelate ligase [Paraburkholderia sp.]